MIKEIYTLTIFEHIDGKNFAYHNGKYFEITEDVKNLILDLLEDYNEKKSNQRSKIN